MLNVFCNAISIKVWKEASLPLLSKFSFINSADILGLEEKMETSSFQTSSYLRMRLAKPPDFGGACMSFLHRSSRWKASGFVLGEFVGGLKGCFVRFSWNFLNFQYVLYPNSCLRNVIYGWAFTPVYLWSTEEIPEVDCPNGLAWPFLALCAICPVSFHFSLFPSSTIYVDCSSVV